MSKYYSIYCESIACALFKLTNLLTKEISNEDFSKMIEGYRISSGIYLSSLKIKSLYMCCEAHRLIHEKEINDVQHLISILGGYYATVKSDLIIMHEMGNKDIMNSSEDVVH